MAGDGKMSYAAMASKETEAKDSSKDVEKKAENAARDASVSDGFCKFCFKV